MQAATCCPDVSALLIASRLTTEQVCYELSDSSDDDGERDARVGPVIHMALVDGYAATTHSPPAPSHSTRTLCMLPCALLQLSSATPHPPCPHPPC